MRIDLSTAENEAKVRVVLSRRNLLALLAKLDERPPGSRVTLYAPNPVGVRLVVSVGAEEDDEHYQGRQPGPIHPSREEALSHA